MLYTVLHLGKSCGNNRQAHPARLRYTIAFTTSRRSILRGAPRSHGSGNNGLMISHCPSVRSVAYCSRSMVTAPSGELSKSGGVVTFCVHPFNSKTRSYTQAHRISNEASGMLRRPLASLTNSRPREHLMRQASQEP